MKKSEPLTSEVKKMLETKFGKAQIGGKGSMRRKKKGYS